MPNVQQAAMGQLNPDEQSFLDHKRELRDLYEGKYVAIRHGKVVADAPSRRELEKALSRKYAEPVYAMVRRVDKHAFDFGHEDSILIS
jgi:hypothetical protein